MCNETLLKFLTFYISRRRSPVFLHCEAWPRLSFLSLSRYVSSSCFLSLAQARSCSTTDGGMLLSLHHPLALTLTALTKLGILLLLVIVLLGFGRGGRVQGVLVFHYVTISRHLKKAIHKRDAVRNLRVSV